MLNQMKFNESKVKKRILKIIINKRTSFRYEKMILLICASYNLTLKDKHR